MHLLQLLRSVHLHPNASILLLDGFSFSHDNRPDQRVFAFARIPDHLLGLCHGEAPTDSSTTWPTGRLDIDTIGAVEIQSANGYQVLHTLHEMEDGVVIDIIFNTSQQSMRTIINSISIPDPIFTVGHDQQWAMRTVVMTDAMQSFMVSSPLDNRVRASIGQHSTPGAHGGEYVTIHYSRLSKNVKLPDEAKPKLILPFETGFMSTSDYDSHFSFDEGTGKLIFIRPRSNRVYLVQY
jgi:hypothetical protein